MVKKHTKIVSLAYSDSENEDDSIEDEEVDDEETQDSQVNDAPATEDANDNNNERGDSAAEVEPFFEDVHGDRDISILEFHQSLYGKSVDEIQIPFPTKRRCPDDIQRKIEVYYEKVKMGSDLNKSIQKRKDLRNPSIYEKMISYCQINEMATNYPKQIYDPEPFLGSDSYYEELSRLQKEEMEKRSSSRDASKSGEAGASKRSAAQSIGGPEKKSKWDSAPAATSTSAAIAVALSKVQNLAQANKPPVIAAFGTINKRK